MSDSPDVEALLEAFGIGNVRIRPLDPRGHPWVVEGANWRAVVRRARSEFESIRWLHNFLARLAATDFGAPRPIPLLGGASVVQYRSAVWEALSFMPGKRLNWAPSVPLEAAGGFLARFHGASAACSPVEQRPDALPLDQCHPVSAPAMAAYFHENLPRVGYFDGPWCVLHGDCTAANMLMDEDERAVVAMIDFELAHLGPPEADISFALWVNGRTEQPAVALNSDRVRAFVSGYHRVRPLPPSAAQAIPLYLIGRGLQMHVRLERVGKADDVQMQRLQWLHRHRVQLEEVVASALHADESSRKN